RGLLAASQFMAEMERTELILPVTRWVLAEALAQARVWREQGLSLTMAVNISTRSLGQDSTVADSVAEVIATSGTPPHLLTLEITEDALGEASASDILNRLHETGVTLSIAHYGTGRSSLAELQHLPIDEIKIDRSFVAGLARGGDDAVIVRSTIALGHNLGLSVVAEGVEDQATLGLLMAEGCNGAQGDVLSRPCPVAELTSWLTESPPRVAVSASL
ncbi:MAG TPA: EAL domain-containing protein, partial [Solirubrobacteraceae bacterium]